METQTQTTIKMDSLLTLAMFFIAFVPEIIRDNFWYGIIVALIAVGIITLRAILKAKNIDIAAGNSSK
jgi:hypothetical protein